MQKLTVLVLALLMAGCETLSANWQHWGAEEIQKQWLLNSVVAVDMYTTQRLDKSPTASEQGPVASQFLSAQPSTHEVIGYGLGLMAIDYIVLRSMSPDWRDGWRMFRGLDHVYHTSLNCFDVQVCW